MALFGRGKDLDGLVKRIEARQYGGPGEKARLLEELALFDAEIKPELLVRFLVSRDRDLSGFALARIGGRRGGRVLDCLFQMLPKAPRARQRMLVDGIGRFGRELVEDRIGHLLRASRTELRACALDLLATDRSLARAHLRSIREALRDDDDGLRKRAVELLGRLAADDHGVRELLREQLYATDPVVRFATIATLSARPHPDVIEDFFDLLPNEAPPQQNQILRGLRRLVTDTEGLSERVQDRVLPLLAAEDERIRKAAAQLLGSIPDQLYVLRRFFAYAKGIAFWLRDRAFSAVTAVADNTVEAILELLKDDDVDVVVGAVTMAGNSRDPRLFEGLAHLVERESLDWWVKIPAIEHLARIDHPQRYAVLLRALDDDELQCAALACLGGTGDPRAVEVVLTFLDSPRKRLRRAALTALEGLRDPQEFAPLERVARADEEHELRAIALERLEGLGAEGIAASEQIRTEAARAPANEPPLELTMLREDVE